MRLGVIEDEEVKLGDRKIDQVNNFTYLEISKIRKITLRTQKRILEAVWLCSMGAPTNGGIFSRRFPKKSHMDCFGYPTD